MDTIVEPPADKAEQARPKPYYRDDLVTLYHGDCREITDWLAADVLVTDPPYGVAWARRFGDARLGTRNRPTQRDVVAGDRDTSARDGALALWGDKPAMMFGSWRVPRPDRALTALLIWHKEGAYTGPAHAAFFTNHEDVYVMGEGWLNPDLPLRSVITTTEARHHEPRRTGHPTSKPDALMAQLVRRCPPGLIADPFAGSGTTLLACRDIGRPAIGVEVDERYCEVIARRLDQGVLNFGEATG